MAQSDNYPTTLGDRLRLIRIEQFGPDGVSELAQRLGIAPQSWRNYEAIGELTPAAELQRFVELTGVNPLWLLRGHDPKYRPRASPHDRGSANE